MPLYIVTLAARPAGSFGAFKNHTLKFSAGLADIAIESAKSQLRGRGFEIKADAPMPYRTPAARRMPDGYPDHSPGLGN